MFEALSGLVWGDQPEASYAELATQLGTTRENVGVMVHRLRQRFRELLRAEVAHTVTTPAELEDELRHLAKVLAQPG